MSTTITFNVNIDSLDSLTDEAIMHLWHIGQPNPAPFGDSVASAFAECIGREIVRRWLLTVSPALWTHQGKHVQAGIAA